MIRNIGKRAVFEIRIRFIAISKIEAVARGSLESILSLNSKNTFHVL